MAFTVCFVTLPSEFVVVVTTALLFEVTVVGRTNPASGLVVGVLSGVEIALGLKKLVVVIATGAGVVVFEDGGVVVARGLTVGVELAFVTRPSMPVS